MKKNLIYQWSYQILAIILPIITTPYISRVLGVDNIGIFSYQYAIINYFMLFAMLGVNTYGNRYIAQHKDDYDDLCNAFSEIYFAQAAVSAFVTVIYIIYTIAFSKYPVVAAVQSIYVVGCIFDINWLYFGLEQFKVTVLRNFVVKLITVLCIFVFVKNSEQLNRYVFVMALGTIISQCIMWFSLKSYVKLRRVSFHNISRHYKGLLILFIPAIATSVYKLMDKIMLGSITTVTEVGYYENSEKIINLLLSFLASIGTVMLPRISNMVANGEKKQVKKYIDLSMEFVMLVAIGMAFGLVAVANEFVPLFFGDGFEKCVDVISVLSLSIIFSASAQIVRTQYLIPHNKDFEYTFSLIVGAVVNVIANYIFIGKYGAMGAAVGTLMAEFSVCLFQFIFASKAISSIKYIFQSLLFCLMGLTMYLVIGKLSFQNLFLSLIIKVVIGGITYCILAVIFLYLKHRIVPLKSKK